MFNSLHIFKLVESSVIIYMMNLHFLYIAMTQYHVIKKSRRELFVLFCSLSFVADNYSKFLISMALPIKCCKYKGAPTCLILGSSRDRELIKLIYRNTLILTLIIYWCNKNFRIAHHEITRCKGYNHRFNFVTFLIGIILYRVQKEQINVNKYLYCEI